MRDFLKGKEVRVFPECFPCFLRQTLISLNFVTDDEALRLRVMRAALEEVKGAEGARSPAHVTTPMHRRIRAILGRDPFEEVKSRYNVIALGLYPRLKEATARSADPLLTASKLAIAGNVIDFGIYDSVDIEGAVRRAMEGPPEVDHYGEFRRELDRAGDILYLLDNAGEVVFDRILIEELLAMDKAVTAVVKGGPVINDCTRRDAEEAGLGDLKGLQVVDNGSDAVGTILEETPEEFRRRFNRQDTLIISKGQGNFETLIGEEKNIFFLFQSKCEVISGLLGLPVGSMLLAGGAL